MNRELILVLGGARSGKSRFAVELARSRGERVLFVATGAPGDAEMRRRIEAHRKVRPAHWRTLEVSTNVGQRMMEELGDAQVVLLDCLTLLIANVVGDCVGSEEALEGQVASEVERLLEYLDEATASFIIVSNEVGMGLVPEGRVGRIYRDLLGRVNQRLAQRADEVYMVVAGLPVKLKGWGGEDA